MLHWITCYIALHVTLHYMLHSIRCYIAIHVTLHFMLHCISCYIALPVKLFRNKCSNYRDFPSTYGQSEIIYFDKRIITKIDYPPPQFAKSSLFYFIHSWLLAIEDKRNNSEIVNILFLQTINGAINHILYKPGRATKLSR